MLDWQRHLSGSVKGLLETIVQIKQCSFTGELLIRRAHANTPSWVWGFCVPCSFLGDCPIHSFSSLQPQLHHEGNPPFFFSSCVLLLCSTQMVSIANCEFCCFCPWRRSDTMAHKYVVGMTHREVKLVAFGIVAS